jgi:3-deoxy-7-phosphoheptulonate synthase
MSLPIPADLPAAVRDRLADVFARPAVEPDWGDSPDRAAVLAQLAAAPTVTTAPDVDRLTGLLAAVAAGRGLLLQADCAYPFRRANAAYTVADARTLSDVATLLMAGTGLGVTVVARLGGQYAFPVGAGEQHTEPSGYRYDAHRMLAMYANASATRNVLHELGEHSPPDSLHRWSDRLERYADRDDAFRDVAAGVRRTVRFLLSVRPHALTPARRVYTAHRAAMLEYDAALLRAAGDRLYALSADSLWLGGPIAASDGAHVAFAATVRNPVSVTVGAGTTAREAAMYVRLLAAGQPPGRLTFVVRMDRDALTTRLPALLERVCRTGEAVTWLYDPAGGTVRDLYTCCTLLREAGSRLGGLHLGGAAPAEDRPHLDPDRHWSLALAMTALLQELPLAAG